MFILSEEVNGEATDRPLGILLIHKRMHLSSQMTKKCLSQWQDGSVMLNEEKSRTYTYNLNSVVYVKRDSFIQ